jgi:long-subunit acyl-CoA synthetase (AMP-forming)
MYQQINRPEWMIADLASNAYAFTVVPLYDTLGPDAVEYILNHAEPPIIACSLDKVSILLQIADKCPHMKCILSMDPITPLNSAAFGVLKSWAAQARVALFSFAEVEQLGAKHRVAFVAPHVDDVAVISYTSGTTGAPKGAMLSHGNLVTMAKSMLDVGTDFTEDDVHISYLPLAHVYERVIIIGIMANGAAAGFFRGDGN